MLMVKEKPALRFILNKAEVEGAILIFDQDKNTYYTNEEQQAKNYFLPASTFKIPHTVIGLELGIIKDEQRIFKWDGKKRALSSWEKDLNLKEAFQKSCVPCYQEMAREIGVERMIESLNKLNYKGMDIRAENIDSFWLKGNSKINAFEQIDFLKRLYQNQLSVAERTTQVLKNIMKIEETPHYVLSAKTGLAVSGKTDIGWFVGYLEADKKVVYFATKIAPKQSSMPRNEFLSLRKKVTLEALEELGFIF